MRFTTWLLFTVKSVSPVEEVNHFFREANVSRFLFYDEDDEMVLLGDWRVMDQVTTKIPHTHKNN